MNRKAKSVEHYFAARPNSKPRLGLIQTFFRKRRFEFMTASGVFSKNRIDLGTRLLVESMVLPEKGRALDIGCGYGVVGIAAASFNPGLQIVMVDVNARAIRLARQNAVLNKAWNVDVRRGHLYEPVKDLAFDCVVTNPPVSAGMKTVKVIISESTEHLSANGTLQMVVRSKIGGKRLQSVFKDAFGNVSVLSRGSGYRVLISKKQ